MSTFTSIHLNQRNPAVKIRVRWHKDGASVTVKIDAMEVAWWKQILDVGSFEYFASKMVCKQLTSLLSTNM